MRAMTENTAPPLPQDDPKPTEPERPAPGDCCHSGCAFCVEDLYQDELDRYRVALAAWQARHPAA